MNSDDPNPSNTDKTWLERLSDALLREPQDREQLLALLRDAQARDLLDADALSMIEGVLQVSHLRARDIMVPRTQMAFLDVENSLEEILPTIIDTAHSRFPVLDDQHLYVIGILHAKDLLPYTLKENKPFILKNILRPANVVPESKKLDKLLNDFRVTRNHMAIVVDEYGALAGLITIEDVIEQIVGEIDDEFDIEDDAYIKKHSENEFIVKALTPIEEFNHYFKASLNDDEFDTVGGIVSNAFGHIPQRDEVIKISDFQFKVLTADNRHIRLLQVCTPR